MVSCLVHWHCCIYRMNMDQHSSRLTVTFITHTVQAVFHLSHSLPYYRHVHVHSFCTYSKSKPDPKDPVVGEGDMDGPTIELPMYIHVHV